MGNYLILTTVYRDSSFANSICMRNINHSLTEKGNKVYVLCYEGKNENNDENIFTIAPPSEKKYSKHPILRKMQYIFDVISLLKHPVINKTIARDFCSVALSVCKEKSIDTVVCTYNPLETLVAVERLKKNLPNIKTVVYELDSVGDGIGASARFSGLVVWSNNRYLKRIYRSIDRIIVMTSHEQYWNDTFGEKFSDKCILADIPVLIQSRFMVESVKAEASDNILMVYAGLIEKEYRSPTYLLNVLKELCRNVKFEFDFYSRGDCEGEIAEASKTIKSINQRGYVLQDELNKAIINADFLISIGNSISRSVPSKVINYLSFGKPIIHFYSQKDDVCIDYLKRYPLSLVIDQSRPVEESSEMIMMFIKEVRGKTVDFESVRQTFYMNDPAYSADIICDVT